ncbi:MAG: amidohydrolase [Thermoplasmata archaeon]
MARRTILLNCTVRTMDPARPEASAVGIEGDRIQFVGSEDGALRWGGARARRLELAGATVLPGFIDCHAHFLSMGVWRNRLDLSGARSEDEVLRLVRARARRTPKGKWILGRGWDESGWPGRRYLERGELDKAAPEHPVLLVRVCGHMCAVNTRALRILRGRLRGRRWRWREGGCRGQAGHGTNACEEWEVDSGAGLLRERAMESALELVRPDGKEMEAGLRIAISMAHRMGVTSVHDIVDVEKVRAYRRAQREGWLGVRACLHLELPEWGHHRRLRGASDLQTPFLRLGGIKLYADGSIGARTAALSEPYADEAGNRGLLLHSTQMLVGTVRRAERERVQLLVHAIGDRAVERVVSAFSEGLKTVGTGRARPLGLEASSGSVISAAGPSGGSGGDAFGPGPGGPVSGLRHRIEHLELVGGPQLKQMRGLGLWACMQPNFIGEWGLPGGMMEARLGERYREADPLWRVFDAGVPLIFGSDCMPFGPLYGIHCAVSAPFEAQRLTVEEAVAACTRTAAAASFEEDFKGTITVGKAADLVVLSGDPFREPAKIKDMRVGATIINGRVVWRSRSRPGAERAG